MLQVKNDIVYKILPILYFNVSTDTTIIYYVGQECIDTVCDTLPM